MLTCPPARVRVRVSREQSISAGTGICKPLSHVCAHQKTRGRTSLSKPHLHSRAGQNEWRTHCGVLFNEFLATELPCNKQTNKSNSPATQSWASGESPPRGVSEDVYGKQVENCLGGRV